jgi:hypothetical protein
MRIALITLLSTALAGCATARIEPAPLESSFARGRELLAAAAEAHGGEARIGAMTAARLHLAGEFSNGLQGQRPEAVLQPAKEGDFDIRVVIDLASNRYRTAGEQRATGGFALPFTSIWSDGTLKFVNSFPPSVTRLPLGDADEGREQAAAIGTRMQPALLLKLATQRMATVRDEGSGQLGERAVRRLGFNADKNTRVTLLLDATTHRVLGLEQLAGDPLVGVTTTRWVYAGDQHVDGLLLPRRASVQGRGIEFISITLLDARFDASAQVTDEDFAIDPRLAARIVPPLAIEELRPGLWEVSNAGRGNYRVHFVELPDRVVAYDAPVSPAVTRAVIAKMREKVPGKPISHVVLSHFHDDHVGGARAFAEAGAILVTTADARPVIERLMRAPAPLTGLADVAPPPDPRFELVGDELEIGSEARSLKVVNAQGSPHVNRMLVLHDVSNRVAMAADMYSDVAPFNPTFDWFAAWLADRDGIDLLAGAHHAATPVSVVVQKRADWRARLRPQADPAPGKERAS